MLTLSPDLTVPQIAAELDPDHHQILAAVDDGDVRSNKADRTSAIRRHGVGGGYVTGTVRRLQAAGLVQRVGADWYLTPAGGLILKRYAGGAR